MFPNSKTLRVGEEEFTMELFTDIIISWCIRYPEATTLDLGDLSNGAKKADYYSDPKEILARSLEIAALLAFEAGVATFEMWDYGLIKTRAFYESFEGIYFNFNSFDDKTIEELIELYKFFFDTSYGEPNSTYIDNFIKINTNYQRQKKDIFSIYKNISNNAKSEKKAIYSMVNGDNIKLIIDNKPYELSLEELTVKMLANLGYAGNHPARAMEEDWAKVKEDKAKVCMTLIEAFKKESSNKEYIEFLIQLQSLKVFDSLEYSVGLSGFSKMSVRTSVRKKIKELFPEGSYLSYVAWSSHCRRNVLELVEDKELLNLVAKDEILKPLLFKGEGYHIIVKEENVKTVLKRLESFGYYND
jgi:hypothetical protein